MILPDINLLIHSYNTQSPAHPAARSWWEDRMTDDTPVLLPWVVVLGFVRLSTHPKLATHPLPVAMSCAIVESWLRRPQVSLLQPGDRHTAILFGFLRTLGTGGNMTTDAHLAALAIEHDLEVCTTDRDFDRFPGLRWRNPLLEG